MTDELYYEDFAAGQQFKSLSYNVDKEKAVAFAHEFDPQPQHLDDEAAKGSLFGQLAISGWHTAAITMKLKLQTPLANVAKGLVGIGLENVRWPRHVIPGDTLHIVITVLDKRLSKSKPDKGIIRYKVETFNQRDELVMEMVTAVIVHGVKPDFGKIALILDSFRLSP